MRDVVIQPKTPDEVITVSFPFQDVLEFGETISGAAVAAAVFAGTDADPNDIIFGAATVSGGFTVQQVITGGLPGVIYNLQCVANGDGGHVYSKSARLAIIRPVEFYTGP